MDKITDRLRGGVADVVFHSHRVVVWLAKRRIYSMRDGVTNCIEYRVRNLIINRVRRVSGFN